MGYPVLVGEENGVITGTPPLATGVTLIRFVIPLNIRYMSILLIRWRGPGTGAASRRLIEARACGKHVMVAGIESQNQASLHLHSTLGFKTTAQMPPVGTKFGRWLDLTSTVPLDDRREPDASR